MSKQTTIQCIIVVAVFVAGVFLGGLDGCRSHPRVIATSELHVSRTDSTRDITRYAPEIQQPVGRVVYRERRVPYAVHDTTYLERPDTARSIDPRIPPFTVSTTAVFGGDTVGAAVDIPENNWRIELKRKPDTNLTVRRYDSVATSTSVAVEDTKRWGISLFAGYTMGVDDIDKPVLAPAHLRVGIGITYRIWGW